MVTKLQKPGGKDINFLLDPSTEKHVCIHGDKAKESRRERDIFQYYTVPIESM